MINTTLLEKWLLDVYDKIDNEEVEILFFDDDCPIEPQHANYFLDKLNGLEEKEDDVFMRWFSLYFLGFEFALLFAIQLYENTPVKFEKYTDNMMHYLEKLISEEKHDLSFWMPCFNLFHDMKLPLSQALKDLFVYLSEKEVFDAGLIDIDNTVLIQQILTEWKDKTDVDIAMHLFSQIYAMPTEFYHDFFMDVFALTEGKDVAILLLFHPDKAARHYFFQAFSVCIKTDIISPLSLKRLQVLASWLKDDEALIVNGWIKQLRKKGVLFEKQAHTNVDIVSIKATDIDGTGGQAIFILLKQNKQYASFLLSVNVFRGIRDVFWNPWGMQASALALRKQTFCDVDAYTVNVSYCQTLLSACMGLMRQNEVLPPLHFVLFHAYMGVGIVPSEVNIHRYIQERAVTVSPFTPDILLEGLKLSASWPMTEPFLQTWYPEATSIDHDVNHCAKIVEGAKIIDIEKARALILSHHLESNRKMYVTLLFWVFLFFQAKKPISLKKIEGLFFLIYALDSDMPLNLIPFMVSLADIGVGHSMETMLKRRTYLTREK